jgi:osmotically-inducible protein OsmY
MAHQSRDWRRTESFQQQGRGAGYRGRDDRGYGPGQWDEENDFGPRSAEGIGDYGGYSEEDRSHRSGEGSGRRDEGGEFLRRSSGRDDRSRYFGADGGPDYGRGYGAPYQSNVSGYEQSGSRGGDYLAREASERHRGGGERWPSARDEDLSARRAGNRWPSDEQAGRDYPSSGYTGYRSQSGWGDRYGAEGWDSPFEASAGRSSERQGVHRGKGPRGYERSDERLKEVVSERLAEDPYIDASDITVSISSGVVKLTGTVDSRASKYQVEELIERCGGVKDIDNQLRTQSRSMGQSSGVGGSSGLSGSYGSGATSMESGAGTRRESGSTASGSSTSSSKKQ